MAFSDRVNDDIALASDGVGYLLMHGGSTQSEVISVSDRGEIRRRGEVGLIFAQMGLATGALDDGLFSAVVLMVMVTTFIAPPWLARLGKGAEGPPDESTLDELVYGEDEP